MKSRDVKILYPFGSDIANNYPEENPEIFFHCSSYGRQIYLKKNRSKYQICTYHFFNILLPHNIDYDDEYLVAHRDDIIPIYETTNFLEVQEKFYESSFRLLVDDDVLAKKANSSFFRSEGKGYFYI